MTGTWVADRTWKEVESQIKTGAIGILPVAAACKEHGLHLPMNTDQIQADWLVRQLASTENILIWPTVTYGFYPLFTEYPGSCTLQNETFSQMICEILETIIHSEIRHVLIINTGISTIAPLEHTVLKSAVEGNVTLFNVYSGNHFQQAQNKLQQQKLGQHADEIETSIMLAIAPECVDMSFAEPCNVIIKPGPLNRMNPDQPNFSASGVIGNPSLATVEKGRQLSAAMVLDLVDLCQSI
jgi:creatinine amidohydrolase